MSQKIKISSNTIINHNMKVHKMTRRNAYNIVVKNVGKIHSSAIPTFKRIALYGHESKIMSMIEEINNKKSGNRLTVKDIQKAHKRYLEEHKPIKPVVKHPEFVTLYPTGNAVVVKVTDKQKNGHKLNKPSRWDEQLHEFTTKITIPYSERNNNKYIEEAIKQELTLSGAIQDANAAWEYGHVDIHSILNYELVDGSNFKETEMLLSLADVPMKSASYAKLDIKGLTDYSFNDNECVLGAIKHIFPVFTDEYLLEVFEEARMNKIFVESDTYGLTMCKDDEEDDTIYFSNDITLKSTDGFTANDLLYLAQKHDFSLYGLDWHQDVFIKYIKASKNKNSNPVRYNGNTCNNRSFVFVLKNNHCYVIDDDKEISRITHENAARSNCTTSLFRQAPTKKNTPFELELPIYNDIASDKLKDYNKCIIMYSRNNIKNIVVDLFKLYNIQLSEENLKLAGTHIIYAYVTEWDMHLYADVNYNEDYGTNYINMWELCLKEKMTFAFNNQSIQNVTINQYNQLMSTKYNRVTISETEKNKIIKRAENKCENCHEELEKGRYEFHHVEPRANGGSNEADNIKVLCVGCHLEETNKQKDEGAFVKFDKSESSFNGEVKKIFDSDLVKAYAFIERLKVEIPKKYKKTRHIDHSKMRRHCVLFNTYEYPVYTVVDEVEEYTQQKNIKCGMYYVETNNYFPMRGTGWYMHNMVDFCMKEGIIAHENIKYQLLPSLTVPADYFNEFFQYIVDHFGIYSKLAINSFIGCMNRKTTSSSKLTMTTSKDDALFEFYKNKATYPVFDKATGLWMIYKKTDKEIAESRAPIYKMILEAEAIEMYKLDKLIKSCNGIPYYYNTDCIYAKFKDTRKIYKAVESAFWNNDDKVGIKKYRFEANKHREGFVERCAGWRHNGIYNKLNRVWRTITDANVDKDFSGLVKQIIESNQSWLVNGPAGCGKSYFVKELMKEIKNYFALAPTNKACRIIDGMTIHKFLATSYYNSKSLGKAMAGVTHMIIDEVSMVPEVFFKVFATIKKQYPAVKFILVGDFRQLLPVADRVGTVEYENSAVVHELCDGNKLLFIKCRRSDDAIFNMCKPENISKVTKERFNNKFCMRHVCFTNKKRIEINSKCMTIYAEQQRVINLKKKRRVQSARCPKYDGDEHSQDVVLMPGMPAISRINCRKLDIVNNETFTIEKVDNNVCVLNDGEEKTVEIPTNEFTKNFHIAFCITCHKSQGQTFDHEYSISEWELMDDRMKYVALSRATKIEYINVCLAVPK